MRLTLLKYLLLFCCLLFLSELQAVEYSHKQDVFTKFRNLTTHDGLSNNHILDIKQDAYGFVWIATRHGLNRYDGYEFKHYYYQESDSTSLPSNYITSIDFDYKGCMWVGTRQGLARYMPSGDGFECSCVYTSQQSGISDPYVRKVMADKHQAVLWVETVDGALNKIDLKTKEVERFKHDRILAATYDYHELYRDRAGKLWLGGRDMGPFYFDEEKQSFHLLPVDYFDTTKKRDKDIACIYQDSDSLYWMSATDGFYQYLPESNTFKKHLASSTFDIVEEDSNYLWLATGSGLERYHKYRYEFTNYSHNPNDKNSLVSGRIKVLMRDRDGNLWVGTSKGISILYRRHLFTHYRHIPETETSMPFDHVRDFMASGKDKIWIATHGGGTLEWDTQSDKFTTLPGTENQRINTLFRDSRGDTYMGMWSGTGFLRYSREGQVQRFALNFLNTKSDWYNDFFEDHKDRLMVGVWGSWGVQFFNRDDDRFEKFNLRLPEAHTRTLLNCVAVQDAKVWVCWNYSFVHLYDSQNKKYEGWAFMDEGIVLPEWRNDHSYHYDADLDASKQNQIVEDREYACTYWCGNGGLRVFEKEDFKRIKTSLFTKVYGMTEARGSFFYLVTDGGVVKMNRDNRHLQLLDKRLANDYKKVFELDHGQLLLVSDTDVTIYGLETGQEVEVHFNLEEKEMLLTTNEVLLGDKMLIATDNGLIVTEGQKKGYTLYNVANYFEKGLIANKINGVVASGKQKYWLGTDKGLLLFDLGTETFTLLEASHNNSIEDITLDGNTLWMASYLGLARYDVDTKEYELISNLNRHKLTSHLTNFIEADSAGNIWVGTSNRGVNMIDTTTYDISHFLPDMENPKAFWGEDAQAMAVDGKGIIYISSNQGLNIYDAEECSFSHLTESDGLPSNDLRGIVFDDNGLLWGVSDAALWVYHPQTKQVLSYSENWGLIPYRFSGAIANIDGRILLGSDQGFYAFDPEELLAFEEKNQLGFTGLKVFAEQKQTDMVKSGELKLNYDENFFTIRFSDFSFTENSSHYLYKLKGIDPDWVFTEQNNAAYTNIPHGEYRFLVTTLQNQRAGLEPAELKLVIIPPLWKKTWFVFIEALLFFGLVYWFYRQRIKQYEQREKYLVIEQKLLRSQMSPHFVFNALIAIQSFIFQNNPKEAGRYLSKFAKLMRLFLQNTRQEFTLLSDEIETLENYLELQRLRFADAFDYHISYADNVNPEEIKLPPMMAQPFIENAIEHGFKGITYQGIVEVYYILKNGALEIRITDNGIGIDQSEKHRKHKSLATTITRERLKNLSTKNKKYSLNISDLKSRLNNKTGTEVLLRVPYENEYNLD